MMNRTHALKTYARTKGSRLMSYERIWVITIALAVALVALVIFLFRSTRNPRNPDRRDDRPSGRSRPLIFVDEWLEERRDNAPEPEQNWIRAPYSTPELDLAHADGIAWYDAPVPARRHDCRAQTRAWHGLNFVERCACGAVRYDGRHGVWINRNERRQEAKS